MNKYKTTYISFYFCLDLVLRPIKTLSRISNSRPVSHKVGRNRNTTNLVIFQAFFDIKVNV